MIKNIELETSIIIKFTYWLEIVNLLYFLSQTEAANGSFDTIDCWQ